MTAADSTQTAADANSADTTKRRRSGVRSIEYRRRAGTESASRGYATHVGRVGALAVALGVGSAVVAVPVALADTTGSGGSTGSSDSADASASSGSSGSSATKPARGATRTGRGGSEPDSADPSTEAPARAGGRGSSDVPPASESDSPAVAGGRDSAVRLPGAGSASAAHQGRPESAVAGAGEAGFAENENSVRVSPRLARLVDADSVVVVEDSSEIADSGAAESAVVDAVDATPVAAPPVMSAAASGRVSGLGGSVLAWLGGGGNGDGPAAVPSILLSGRRTDTS